MPSRFRKHVKLARKALDLPPVNIEIERKSRRSPCCIPAFGLVRVGDEYLRGRSDFQVAFAAFHEVGHIYTFEKFGDDWPSSHDAELAADHVAGWLMGRAGFLPYQSTLDVGETWRQPFPPGGIFEHSYSDVPTVPLMLHLRLDQSQTHPAGHDRVYRAALDGWVRAWRGEAPRF